MMRKVTCDAAALSCHSVCLRFQVHHPSVKAHCHKGSSTIGGHGTRARTGRLIGIRVVSAYWQSQRKMASSWIICDSHPVRVRVPCIITLACPTDTGVLLELHKLNHGTCVWSLRLPVSRRWLHWQVTHTDSYARSRYRATGSAAQSKASFVAAPPLQALAA